MLLMHARARAHTSIYQISNPGAVYAKADTVTDPDAEDWEPLAYEAVPPSALIDAAADCGCGTTPSEGNDES
jgi:hypothetical protein